MKSHYRIGYTPEERMGEELLTVERVRSVLGEGDFTLQKYDHAWSLRDALHTGSVDKAFVLMENTFDGRYEKNFDLIFKNRFYINGILPQKVSHRDVGFYYMKWFLVSRDPDVPERREGHSYLTFVAITPHYDRPGLLRDLSSIISIYDVNMTDIFSRPSVSREDALNHAKMFYIVMEGHIMSDVFQSHILQGIRTILNHSEEKKSFHFLGCCRVK